MQACRLLEHLGLTSFACPFIPSLHPLPGMMIDGVVDGAKRRVRLNERRGKEDRMCFSRYNLSPPFPAKLLASDIFSTIHPDPPFYRTFQRSNSHPTNQTPMPVTLMVLILSHFYMVKPEADQHQAVDEFGVPCEPSLIPGMPLLNNAVQLLEWTASCINNFHAFWRNVIF